MKVTEEMLTAAMRKAVELGLFPKHAAVETYLKHWDGMRECLKAAIEEGER